jgi:transposase
MGGRAWREGEKWFLSCQWQMPQPAPLPKTGRTAGVKIAASVLLTTYDDRGQTKEYFMPPPDKKLVALHQRTGRKLSRVLVAQKKREKKIAENGYSQRRAKRLASRNVTARPLRLRRSKTFFETSARLADLEAEQRNARDDFLHKTTTEIVHRFDAISVQKMDVAEMMKKPSTRARRRLAKKLKQEDGGKPKRDLKPVRKMLRHVAMARCRQLLAYKFRDLRGPDAYQEIDKHDINASACSSCGTIHQLWQDGRRMVRCNAVLPDGSECGTVLPRNRNAARLTKRELDRRRPKVETA